MKKILLLSATFAALFTSAQAQVRIAPELGLNINSLRFDAANAGLDLENKLTVGVRAGAMVELGLSDNLYLQPGLFYSLRGGKATADNILGIPADIEYINTLHYIDIPVMLTYKTGTEGSGRFYVGVGPNVSFALAGTAKVKASAFGISDEDSESIEFGSEAAEYKRLDVGANIKAGYELPMGLYFGGFFGMGFIDLSNDDTVTPSAKNMNFGVNVGYLLGGAKKAKTPAGAAQ